MTYVFKVIDIESERYNIALEAEDERDAFTRTFGYLERNFKLTPDCIRDIDLIDIF